MREHPSWAAGRIAVGAAMIAIVLLAGNAACWVVGFLVDTGGFCWWASSWILTIILGGCVTLVISVAYDMQQETKEKSVVTKKQVEREAVDTKVRECALIVADPYSSYPLRYTTQLFSRLDVYLSSTVDLPTPRSDDLFRIHQHSQAHA